MIELSPQGSLPWQRGAKPGKRRRCPRRLLQFAVAPAAMTAGLASTLLWPPRPILLWNASPSSPIGLYAIVSPDRLSAGDMAIAWAPMWARRLAAARHYLPANVPLVKRIAAIPDDRVCATRRTILVNRRPAALRRLRDPSGRPMPWWSGCDLLRSGEFLLLSPGVPDAFDGRYFGVTGRTEIVGKARLLWPR